MNNKKSLTISSIENQTSAGARPPFPISNLFNPEHQPFNYIRQKAKTDEFHKIKGREGRLCPRQPLNLKALLFVHYPYFLAEDAPRIKVFNKNPRCIPGASAANCFFASETGVGDGDKICAVLKAVFFAVPALQIVGDFGELFACQAGEDFLPLRTSLFFDGFANTLAKS